MVEEDDNVAVSSVDFGVAVQSESGRRESGRGETLEHCSCRWHSFCSVVLLAVSGEGWHLSSSDSVVVLRDKLRQLDRFIAADSS